MLDRRVAGVIDIHVVLEGDAHRIEHELGRDREVADQAQALERVATQHCPLGVSERAGLAKHVGVHADLAHVVQQAGRAESRELAPREAEELPHAHRDDADVDAVRELIGVVALHRGHAHERGPLAQELVHDRLHAVPAAAPAVLCAPSARAAPACPSPRGRRRGA